jgi:hypothetical protein
VSTHEELSLLAIGMVNFLAVLLGLTALLSIARKLRVRLSRRHASVPSSGIPAWGDDTVPAFRWVDLAPTKPSNGTFEEYRSRIKNAGSDPVTFVIEPDTGPTRQQRTVQRLIDYLKEESSKTAAPASSL